MKNRFLRTAAAAMAVMLMLTPALSAYGFEYDLEAKKAYEKKLADAQERKADLERSKREAQALIAEYTQEKENIEAYISELDLQLNDISLRLFELQNDIEDTEKELETATADLAEAEARRDEQYQTMKDRVQYIYENGETTYLDVLLNSASISEILNQLEYVSSIQAYDNSLLDRYEQTCSVVQDKKNILEATLEQLTAMQEQEQLEYETIQELYELKAAQIETLCEQLGVADELLFVYIEQIGEQEAEIDDIIAAEEIRVAEEEQRRKEEEERLRREEEARRLAEQRAAERNREGTTSKIYDPNAIDYVVLSDETSPYNMIWPLPGDHRTYSKFGYRKAPLPGASTYHQGWDIGGEFGAPIVAAIAGKVILATYSPSAGNYVKVEHEDGLVTVYMHMSKILVTEGLYVQQGTILGLCGSTGVSTGPHLHFGVQINGTYVDPDPYIGHLE